jgi:hypothetical protein
MEYSTYQLLQKDNKSLFGSSVPHPYSYVPCSCSPARSHICTRSGEWPLHRRQHTWCLPLHKFLFIFGWNIPCRILSERPYGCPVLHKACESGGICRFSNTCSGTTQSGAFRLPHECRATISIHASKDFALDQTHSSVVYRDRAAPLQR